MIMVRLFGLLATANLPHCIVCCVSSGVGRWARPLPVHLVEKVGPKDPKIVSLVYGEQ